ncbi:MAG: peptidoglycan recognition family protein [Prosthecobacter sp.]
MKTKIPNRSAVLAFLLLILAILPIQALEMPEVIPLKKWQDKYKYWNETNAPNLKQADPKAQYRENGTITYLTFHHADASPKDRSEAAEIKTLGDKVWMNHARDNTYQDVAYHYLIGQSGRIYKGRPDDIAPASGTYYYDIKNPKYKENGRLDFDHLNGGEKPGNNQGHLTISFLVAGEEPSKEAYDSAVKLAAFLMDKHDLKTDVIRVHREVANSTCPGDKIHKWIRGRLGKEGHKLEGDGIKRIKALLPQG